MAGTPITAAEALKAFKGADISVRTIRAIKVKGADGIEREVPEAKNRPLSEAGILSAVDFGDRVAITTSDGKKYEAKK
jgi:hypothetical protein